MTYFELIKNLKSLEKNKRDEESFNKFINSDIILYTNMNYRFGVHLIKFIQKKLDNCYKDFINTIVKSNLSEEEFSIQVIDLKNELKYLQNFTNIKYLIPECNNDIKNIYDNITNKYNDMISNSLKELYDEKYSNNYLELLRRKEVNNEL